MNFGKSTRISRQHNRRGSKEQATDMFVLEKKQKKKQEEKQRRSDALKKTLLSQHACI